MSGFNWCHGPTCHEQHTQDRIRGVKGSKVLRTRKLRENHYNQRSIWGYFCSMGCYNDFAKEHMADIIAIAPRTEALETPVNVEKVQDTTYGGHTYTRVEISRVDNNIG